MGAEINRDRFLADIREIARKGQHPTQDVAVAAAAMVVALTSARTER